MPDYKRLFLLGGHDLEMIEIKHLLENNNEIYIDRNLAWGAKLSEYADQLGFNGAIYGIELEEDTPLPPNYQRIDHHNELSHLPASIEQVAHIVRVQLTREQQLIAANDRGYIPAMKAIGASGEEIADIRLKDRRAQGITEEDERLGQQSIDDNLTWENKVAIINALTPRFPTITDRMFGVAKQLIVHTPEKVVYYGPNIDALAAKYKEWIPKKAYYGGGPSGFFGTVEGAFSADELMNKVIPSLLKFVA